MRDTIFRLNEVWSLVESRETVGLRFGVCYDCCAMTTKGLSNHIVPTMELGGLGGLFGWGCQRGDFYVEPIVVFVGLRVDISPNIGRE